ncbi:hypothetical protein [Streptomyces rhizosphaericus]|uniref:Uncharacterized protein n=1 Tax=Streptomyces rhizosphaericus TaxID=114699 RepID=A0A6G4AQC5_9ACTN|nr:hypothetical protein [Streptomyces rhizosphaericus]NEW75545.1 hypothetical protein [Streptomyces rhizosphaericus]
MADPALDASRTQVARQVAHWAAAAERLRNLDEMASSQAWAGLESYLGISVRRHLTGVVDRLLGQAAVLRAELETAETGQALELVRRHVLAFTRRYLRAEITVDFYTDAIQTRTSPRIAGLLRACDTLAYRSLAQALDRLDRPTPIVLSYVDTGLGASILKAGLRLWDGASESPAAAIKIARHNLLRPTALIHEAGHQFAHACAWTEELATALRRDLPPGAAEPWAGWASEVAADAFAFVHTGYASVAALHDVVTGETVDVHRVIPGDPHPPAYLRVLLGVQMCRTCYGAGPWDDLAEAWIAAHPVRDTAPGTDAFLRDCLPVLAEVVRLSIDTPMKAFAGRSLSALVPPARAHPKALDDLERRLGPALYNSMHWIWTEALRLLALTGLRVATQPGRASETLRVQEEWMLRLGAAVPAA